MQSSKEGTTADSGVQQPGDCRSTEASCTSANKKAEEELDSLDYVHFVIPDIQGIPRGVVVPRKFVRDKIKEGLQICYAILLSGPNSEETDKLQLFRDVKNGTWQPDCTTLMATPWGDSGGRKTGMMLCQLAGEEVAEELDTRQTLQRLLDTLGRDHGLVLKSAFEFEFTVYQDDGKVWGDGYKRPLDLRAVQPDLDTMYELVEVLQQAGLQVISMEPELGPGMWELNLAPEEGLKAVDVAFHVKNAVKIFFRRRGCEATFMSCPELGPSAEYVDLHFNHSLWTEDGRNAMKDDDDAISQLALQWNAGLLQHAPALTAVCRPTINCQRRLPASVCSFPAQGLWAVETRTGVTRFKVARGNVFLESRVAQGAASPYLVVASHLVAGMSGLSRKLTSPPPMDTEHAQKLPSSLEEALLALEKDDVMKKGLGHQFVRNYVTAKRHYEILPYKETAFESDEQAMEYERKMYFKSL